MFQKLLNKLATGMRNKGTTLVGSIPGAAVALTEISDLIDDNADTVFEPRVFILALCMAGAFWLASDAK